MQRKSSYQSVYDALLACATDPTSELFVEHDGALHRRTGAAHRCEFWAGLDGARSFAARGSLARACYEAGQRARCARQHHPRSTGGLT